MHDDEAVYLTPAEGFDLLADTYDARLSGDPGVLLETAAVLGALPSLTGAIVADLGCGTGRYTRQLVRLGAARTLGVDLSEAMLARAAHLARRAELPIEWLRGDLNDTIALPDASLDVAVCARVVSFLPKLEAPFVRIARLLRPGGFLVVSEIHPGELAAARAASTAAFRKDRAPYLRFTSFEGRECRLPRTPHRTADLFAAARAAGLILERLDEPVADSRLAATCPAVQDRIGVPLALVMTLRRGA